MHIAASRGHLECVNCLIEAKAELDAPTALSAGGNTPLHLAIARNYTNVAMVLLHAGADFDLANGQGYTSIHLAAREGLLGKYDFYFLQKLDITTCFRLKAIAFIRSDVD